MSNDWTIYVIIGAAFMVLARLDRLAKQLEAVNADIKAELAPYLDSSERASSKSVWSFACAVPWWSDARTPE